VSIAIRIAFRIASLVIMSAALNSATRSPSMVPTPDAGVPFDAWDWKPGNVEIGDHGRVARFVSEKRRGQSRARSQAAAGTQAHGLSASIAASRTGSIRRLVGCAGRARHSPLLRRCGIIERSPLAIVLGSGLGAFADEARDATVISYLDIPGFPVPSVEGHAGVWWSGP